MVRKVLLGCGIVSSVLYVVTDIIGTLRYPGYSYAHQTFSELTAQGAPTRPFMVALNGITYGVLVAAFAVGVWTSAAPKRAAPITGAMLLGYAVFGMAGGVLFPMRPREALAAGEGTLRNVMHIPATSVMSLFILLAMGFGSTLLGKRFGITRTRLSPYSLCLAFWQAYRVARWRQTNRRHGWGLRSASTSTPPCSGRRCWPSVSYAPRRLDSTRM